MDIIKKSELKIFDTNPFIVELKGKMYLRPSINTFVSKGEAILNLTTGELVKDESIMLGRKRYVDKSQFCKIYASEIKILFDLSKCALNVFYFITKIVNYDNLAYVNPSKHFKEMGYESKNPVIDGIKELAFKNIIACSDIPHHYWLNPTIACKGERFAVYTEYILNNDTYTDTEEISKEFLEKQITEKNKILKKDPTIRKKMDLANKESLFPN